MRKEMDTEKNSLVARVLARSSMKKNGRLTFEEFAGELPSFEGPTSPEQELELVKHKVQLLIGQWNLARKQLFDLATGLPENEKRVLVERLLDIQTMLNSVGVHYGIRKSTAESGE